MPVIQTGEVKRSVECESWKTLYQSSGKHKGILKWSDPHNVRLLCTDLKLEQQSKAN